MKSIIKDKNALSPHGKKTTYLFVRLQKKNSLISSGDIYVSYRYKKVNWAEQQWQMTQLVSKLWILIHASCFHLTQVRPCDDTWAANALCWTETARSSWMLPKLLIQLLNPDYFGTCAAATRQYWGLCCFLCYAFVSSLFPVLFCCPASHFLCSWSSPVLTVWPRCSSFHLCPNLLFLVYLRPYAPLVVCVSLLCLCSEYPLPLL